MAMLLRALATLPVLLLTGCAALSGDSPLSDLLRVATSAQAVALPDPAAFPYASQRLRREGAPEALIVLAQRNGLREQFAMADGAVITLQQGRLVETSGLVTDIRLHQADALPPPARALEGRRPVCWQSGWRAWGESLAGRHLLNGCLSEATEPADRAQGLRQVREVMQSPAFPGSWENRYWLTTDLRVVRSEQQPGPAIPRWTFSEFKASPAGEPVKSPVWVPGPVSVRLTGAIQRDITSAARLSALTGPLLGDPRIDWPASTLYRLDASDDLRARQAALVTQLRQLADRWQQARRHALAGSARRLAEQVVCWRLGHPVPVQADPARLAFQPANDLRLTGSRYVLHLARDTGRLPVQGLLQRESLRWNDQQVLRDLDNPRQWLPGADRDALWVLAQGRVTRIDRPLAAWSGIELPPDARLLARFDPAVLPPEAATLNTELLELARHVMP